MPKFLQIAPNIVINVTLITDIQHYPKDKIFKFLLSGASGAIKSTPPYEATIKKFIDNRRVA